MGLSASQARFLQLTARRGDIEYEAQRINFERLQLASNLSDASNKYEEATTNRQLTFSFNTGSEVQEVVLSYANYRNYMNQQLEGLQTTQSKYYLVSQSGKIVVGSEEEKQQMIEQHTAFDSIESIEAAKAKTEAYNNQAADAEDRIQLTDEDRRLAAIDLSGEYMTRTIEDEEGNSVLYYVHQEFSEDDIVVAPDLDNVELFQNAIKEGIYFFAQLEKDSESEQDVLKRKGWETLGGGAISEEYDKTDDAAAEAEFRTTQARIQKLDKKLELRLDQLETQRSAITTEMESIEKVIQDSIEQSFKTFG